MGIKFSSVETHTKFTISIRVVERSPDGVRAAPRIMTLHGGSLDQGVGEPDGIDCLCALGTGAASGLPLGTGAIAASQGPLDF